MLRFIFRKMFNKKWMMLSLLIGNVFLISIAMCGPMYTRAVTQNLLTRSMADAYAETGEYPALFTLEANLSSGDAQSSTVRDYLAAVDNMENLTARLNTPALYETEYAVIADQNATPDLARGDSTSSIKLSIATMSGLDEHSRLAAGKTWSAEPDADGIYDVLVSRSAFIRKALIMDEVLTYPMITGLDGEKLRVRIAGVFESDEDPWWIQDESYYSTQIFMPPELFHQLFINTQAQTNSVSFVYTAHIDYTKMNASDVETIIAEIDRLNDEYNLIYMKKFVASCEELLKDYRMEANRAAATLKVLQAPIFALLIAFIFMLSRQTLEIEQSEISVLKSRGASGGQIMRLYLTQSAIITFTAMAISIPFSAFLCQAIGSANAFLQFVSRSALRVEYTLEVALYAAAAVTVAILAMVLPAISYSRLTIVDAKRAKHSLGQKPVWQKFYIDIILLAVSIYGLYTFNNQKAILAERAAGGAALDPLIYIASSLFAVGAALFMVRVIPMIASAIFSLFKRFWKPAMYASYLQVLRSRNSLAFMMTFLMLTISIGILNADTASTVNALKEQQERYDLGADVVLKEAWKRENGEYVESDIARYEQIDGVVSVAKVQVDNSASITSGSKNLSGVRFMAVDAKSFGETAYMKDALMDEHFYSYLNSMSQTLNAALVSTTFRDILGLREGDTITVKSGNLSPVTLTIARFVDYFPTYNRTGMEEQQDGTLKQTDKYLVAANLGYVQSVAGLSPYEIWIKTPESADAVYEYAMSSGTRYWAFADIFTHLDTLKNSPAIQGTNGILTLSFIVGLTLCAVGFLIFWILSIRSRSLQFGIYRAMGMSVGEIVAMLINEHVWQSLSAVIAGTGIGYLVSLLFIPLIQLAYSSADASLPLTVTRDLADHIKLVAIILVVLIVCVYVLITIIRRLKIAQALKIGED